MANKSFHEDKVDMDRSFKLSKDWISTSINLTKILYHLKKFKRENEYRYLGSERKSLWARIFYSAATTINHGCVDQGMH